MRLRHSYGIGGRRARAMVHRPGHAAAGHDPARSYAPALFDLYGGVTMRILPTPAFVAACLWVAE